MQINYFYIRVPTKTTPPATAGEDATQSPVAKLHIIAPVAALKA